MLGIKTILHPTDFSEPSSYALDVACQLAADYGASLVIIHVLSVPHSLNDGIGAARVSMKKMHASWSADGSNSSHRAEKVGPASEILNLAEVCNADLIVMGSRGRDGTYRDVMGSVAEAILREAACPVLTVSRSQKTCKRSAPRPPNRDPVVDGKVSAHR
jgi:universal stress protein A